MRNYFLASLLILITEISITHEENQKEKPKYTQCGITSDWTFTNWAKSIETQSPTVFPKNDEELRNYLQTIKANNCKARPVGATHSAGGLVLENNVNNTIAVSLAFYEPDDTNWTAQIIVEENSKSVRIPTGKSLLDLVSLLRPKKLFTPSQTAGFIFAVGGVISNTVHGGYYDKGFINYYVTKMRVMLSSGEIKVIEDKDEIKYWRQSFGLLGIVTSVEIELEERDDFTMATIENDFSSPDFTEEEFNKAMADTRKNGEIYGEFFFNAYNSQLFSVIFRNTQGDSPNDDSGCYWNYSAGCCYPEAFCSYQYKFGDLNFSESCRIKKKSNFNDIYTTYHISFPDIPTKGDPTWIVPGDEYGSEMADIIYRISKIPLLAHDGSICKTLAGLTSLVTKTMVPKSQRESDDGYWLRTAPRANIMAYFFRADTLFKAIKAYQNVVYSLLDGSSPVSRYTTFKFNQPCEWRYVTLNSTLASKYQVPNLEGEFVVIEALNINDDLDDFKWGFAQLEHDWLAIGGIPHLGKIWGFDYTLVEKGIRPEPFSKDIARKIMTPEQKSHFKEYQSKVDPDGLFSGGLAIEFFK